MRWNTLTGHRRAPYGLLGAAALMLAVGCSAPPAAMHRDAAVRDAAIDAPHPPDGQRCTADCECANLCCEDGICQDSFCNGRPIGIGVCGTPLSGCPCVGGTCDSRGCCVLPDGAIDTGGGPACIPPGGVPPDARAAPGDAGGTAADAGADASP